MNLTGYITQKTSLQVFTYHRDWLEVKRQEKFNSSEIESLLCNCAYVKFKNEKSILSTVSGITYILFLQMSKYS